MDADAGALIAALEQAPSGMALLGDGGCLAWVNHRMCRLLQRDRDTLVGCNLGELMHPEDVEPSKLEPAAHEPGRTADLGRKRFMRPDGTFVWTALLLNRIARQASDAPPRLVANAFDLTELVLAEGRLGSIVAGLDEAVVSIDGTGRVAVANRAARRLLGSGATTLVGLDLADPPWAVVDEAGEELPPERRPELVALGTGEPALATIGLKRDGETQWVEVSAHPLVRAGEPYVAATYKDVSERLRIEAALKHAESADRAKSEFLSRMSHELRTPLHSVLGFAQLLQMEDLATGQQDAVDQILRAGRHLIGLLDEVLDLERVESGRLDVRVEPVAAAPVMQAAVELVQPLAVASGVAIDLRVGREGPTHVLADEQRLRQVLLNLLTNGVKFNRPHGRVTISCHVVYETMVIRVRDTGYGIGSADIERVFTPFERLDADRRGIDGAGVGLALAKRLTQAMGGAIGVESEPGRGSTFFVVLRTAGARPDGDDVPPVSPELMTELVRRTDPARRRVLYVEDDANSRELMQRIAEMHGGLELMTESTAAAGVARARREPPDAILLDLHLPDGSGEQVIESLRGDAATCAIPIVVLSADATPARRSRLEAAGAAAYLTKPVDLASLFTALEAAAVPSQDLGAERR
jgi:PAS domain S-box-containing protein